MIAKIATGQIDEVPADDGKSRQRKI